MSYLTFGLNILRYALERAGEDELDTTGDYYLIAKQHVTRSIVRILRAAPFPFALKTPPGILSLVAKSTGTVSSISGSTWTLSLSIAVSQAGKKIYMDDEQVIYRIIAHTAGSATLTVDATYAEDTLTGAYTIFQDEYALASDCLKPWHGWLRNRPEEAISFHSGQEGNYSRPSRLGYTTNRTYDAYIIRHDANGVPQIRISPWTSEAATIEYEYSIQPLALDFSGAGTGDTPIIPVNYRHIIADMTCGYILMDKDDPKADAMLMSADTEIKDMTNEYIAIQKPRFYPASGARLT